MPFVQSFTVSQSAQTPNNVTVTDTSTGVDGAITKRRIYVSNSEGEYLTGNGTVDYDDWLYANASIILNILSESTAVSIRVDWLNVSNAVLYSLTEQYSLPEYSKQFLYYLIQSQGLTPGIVQDTTYWQNVSIFWANLRGAIIAVETGDDIRASQQCLNRCTEMQNNENLYF